MDLHLKNQVVIVTGGSTGLGKAIASMLAAEGAKVAINYIVNPEVAEALAIELHQRYGVETLAVYADVANEADVYAMYEKVEEKLGPVDALVNNAAYIARPQCVDLPLDDFKKCVDVNLQGMFLCTREILRRLIARGAKGRVVNVASQAAVRGSFHGKTAYDMTKAGMCGFTRSLAFEVGQYGINVNAILPGFMYTELISAEIDSQLEETKKRSLLNRIAHVDEIAQVAVFLCSERASYMIGASVDVSGGMALH